ncbi:TRM9B methyltransferase, partial [Polyodon spathula]|nr:TRM9B methyltransferase [Polyodon spathula]
MEKAASQLERDHVHSVYEKIAPHFNDHRYKAWPKVRQFLLDQEPGSIIADIGCGNGKYLHINRESFKMGCDYCLPLVDLARDHGHEVQVCNGLRLPYRDGCFDAILSIAVIHHFSTKERRIRAIQEMARTLRVGGRIMIYVWAMEQKRRKFEKQDVFVPWNPKPPSTPPPENVLKKREQEEFSSSGFSRSGEDHKDMHRKIKSTSSVGDDEDTVYTSFEKSLKLWLFSRSLDSVLDFGSNSHSRSPKELNALSNYSPQLNKMMKQVSSLFCSRQNSEDDEVFRFTGEIQPPNPPKSSESYNFQSDNPTTEEKQALSAAIVHGCGRIPLPDLVSHSKDNFMQLLDHKERPQEDCVLPENKWKQMTSDGSFLRYYHVFKEGELLELIKKHVEGLHVIHTYFDHANWCVIAEKVQVWKI